MTFWNVPKEFQFMFWLTVSFFGLIITILLIRIGFNLYNGIKYNRMIDEIRMRVKLEKRLKKERNKHGG